MHSHTCASFLFVNLRVSKVVNRSAPAKSDSYGPEEASAIFTSLSSVSMQNLGGLALLMLYASPVFLPARGYAATAECIMQNQSNMLMFLV